MARRGFPGQKYKKNTKRIKRNPPARRRRGPTTTRAMVARRAAIVETKKKESAGTLQFGEYYNVVIPDAYEVHSQGLGETDVIGNTIFAKYLNSQMQITFAQDAIQELNQPIVLQVLWGWCKLPLNEAPTRADAGQPAGPNDGVVHSYNPSQYIIDQLTNIFDPRVTLPKNDREILKLKYNKEFNLIGSSIIWHEDEYKTLRFRKPLNFYPKWKPMRKLKLEPVTTNATGVASHLSPTNKPGQWIPFFACINKTNATATGDAAPICLTNSAFYFTDS